jgi:hypothetical protein
MWFMKCLESMQHLISIPNIMKKQIMKTMDKFVEELELIDLVFGQTLVWMWRIL